MIEHEVIDGRPATIAYIDDDFNPASPDDATMIKIMFDDGEIRFGVKSAQDQIKSKFQKAKRQALTLLTFDPSEPRDDSGKWTTGGGGGDGGSDTSGYEFVSPSVKSGMDFNRAVKEIGSDQHANLRSGFSDVNHQLDIAAHSYDIVGAWKDGAENSVMDIADKGGWERLKVSAAMKGYLADQKQVALFQTGEGPSALYSFKAEGDLKAIHEQLLKDGIAFHTLVPRAGGAQVYVIDQDLSLPVATIQKAANGAEVETHFGRAEFIGTTKEDGTDREQRDDARTAYEALISQSPVQGADAVWQRVRDRWSASGQPATDIESKPPPPPPGEPSNPIDHKASVEEKVAQLNKLTAINKPILDEFAASIGKLAPKGATTEQVLDTPGIVSEVSIKKPETIAAKATRSSVLKGKPWFGVEHIRDSLRFRTVVDSYKDTQKIVDAIKASGKFNIIKYDSAKLLNPKAFGWRVLPIDMTMKNGQIVEYYIVSKEQRAVADEVHKLYENWRDHPNTDNLSRKEKIQYDKDMEKSLRLNNGAWKAYLSRTGETPSDVLASVSR